MEIKKKMNNELTKYDICKEIFMVLSHFDNELLKKIPDRLFNMLIELSSKSQKDIYFDMKKPLKDQQVSDEAKDFISLIYYDYLSNCEEKKEIFNAWKVKF